MSRGSDDRDPTAEPDAGPASPLVVVEKTAAEPLHVSFKVSNEAEFDPASFHWVFGDGDEAIGAAPTHDYSEGGSYEVVLHYTDAEGMSGTFLHRLELNDPPEVSISEAGVVAGSDGMTFWFLTAFVDEDSEPDFAQCVWDFGDGSTARGERAEHEYSTEGTYVTRVTCTDPDGAPSADTIVVEVFEVIETAPDDPVETEPDAPLDPAPLPPPSPENDGTIADEPPPPEDEAPGDTGSEPDGSGQDDVSGDIPSDIEPPSDPTDPADETPESPDDPSVPLIPIVEPARLDFELDSAWMDGGLLARATDPSLVYSGAGSLQIDFTMEGSADGVLAELAAILELFADSPEVHVGWFEMWDASAALDVTQIRPALEARQAELAAELTDEELDFLWTLVARLEEYADQLPVLGAGAWYCIELGFYRNTPGLADGAVTLRVEGVELLQLTELVFPETGSFGEATLALLDLGSVTSTDGRYTWIDEIRFHIQQLGCPSK